MRVLEIANRKREYCFRDHVTSPMMSPVWHLKWINIILMWYVCTVIVEQKVIFVKFSYLFYVICWYVGKIFSNICIFCLFLHRFYFLYTFWTVYLLQQVNGVFMECFKFSNKSVVYIAWKRQKMLGSPMSIYLLIRISNKLNELWKSDIVAFSEGFLGRILSVFGYNVFTI